MNLDPVSHRDLMTVEQAEKGNGGGRRTNRAPGIPFTKAQAKHLDYIRRTMTTGERKEEVERLSRAWNRKVLSLYWKISALGPKVRDGDVLRRRNAKMKRVKTLARKEAKKTKVTKLKPEKEVRPGPYLSGPQKKDIQMGSKIARAIGPAEVVFDITKAEIREGKLVLTVQP
jgi:hypothetical protein